MGFYFHNVLSMSSLQLDKDKVCGWHIKGWTIDSSNAFPIVPILVSSIEAQWTDSECYTDTHHQMSSIGKFTT